MFGIQAFAVRLSSTTCDSLEDYTEKKKHIRKKTNITKETKEPFGFFSIFDVDFICKRLLCSSYKIEEFKPL